MSRMQRSDLTIGQLAKAAGVGVETVRYYQRRGLLPKPAKPIGGIRYYGADALRQLQSVKRAQQAGFSLKDIAVLLRLDRVRDRDAAHRLSVRKIAEIDRQIKALSDLRDALKTLTRACERGAENLPCPIIDAFTQQAAATAQRTPRNK
jgi:MerR family transcriptional regulator, mercuric resistance operon regulatory protein